MDQTRLHYLDALRSFCMLFGILVHTGTLHSEAALSQGIFWVSDHFRMATFFIISGFFAVLVLERRGLAGFARHRAVALLVPLAAGLVLLNPVTNWLVYLWHNGPVGLIDYLSGRAAPGERPANWHLHLWFLFSLAVYVALTPLAVPLMRSAPLRALARRAAALQGDLFVILLGLLAVAGEMAGRAVYGAVFEPVVGSTEFAWLFRATLQFAPWFLFGIVAFTERTFFEALHRISWPALVLAGGLVLANARLGLGGGAGTALEVLAEEFTTLVAAAALFALFRRSLSAARPWVAALNDAVYSIYLFHYVLIYALAPGNKSKFDRASQLPLEEDTENDHV